MRVQELTKQYDGKTVVDGVSFAIPKGKVISLIGPNGAGKSTVMGMISRLIAHDSGLVDFEGKDIGKWKSKELSKRLAILTQSNNIQMKLTVRELVTFGRFPYSGNRVTPEDQKIIDRAIAYMELEEFQDRFIDELSGGQRQRAMIAMVIAQDTEYVLLDEPTNNLDIYHATNMMKIVRRLCDELGKTVILVLHEINYVIELNKQISDLTSQNQMLATLKQQGLIDPDIFIAQSNELTEQLRAVKLKKERLLAVDGDNTISQTRELMEILDDGPDFLDSFDAELFGELVETIIVESNERIRFRLKNGLELSETIERTVR